MSDCPICGRPTVEEERFCEYHHRANSKLREKFDSWKKAMDIDWYDYLERIYDLDEAGLWAQEVAEFLMQEDDS